MGAIVRTLSTPPVAEPSPLPRSGRSGAAARRAYLALAVLFWLGVLAQAFLAGAGLFAGGSWMMAHIALGHLLTSPIPLIPLLLLILSAVGRLPKADRWWCALLLILALVQPVVLYFRGVLPLLGALHPVNALLLFALPLYLVARAWRVMRAAASV
jgi:hypothetical protein